MFSQGKNKCKRKAPSKKFIPIAHQERDVPLDLYKSEDRCYRDIKRYHLDKEGKDPGTNGKPFRYVRCSDSRNAVDCSGTGKMYGTGKPKDPFYIVYSRPHVKDCKNKLEEGKFLKRLHQESLTTVSDHRAAYDAAKRK
ncbi:uncharacterized protein LOC122501730 [Leptopilina heterotoma]|uniref:uncharacterized protein LOC122501730 n=1 Tax=Leptopilina heterotoma TaxID=63436 RepID=UPI001CA993F6|nr:uncharacterized protein LOC122501730 [Leptopilina heterotoma]